jgi:two-component system, NtrC family, sensor kinase
MRRGPKPAKSKEKPLVARKWPKNEDSRVRELEKRLAEALKREAEALKQQMATSEILRTITHSQTDVQPVFDTIVQSGARLCHASVAAVFLTDGRTVYHPANHGGSPEALAAVRARFPRPLDMESTPGMAILTRSVVHIPDIEDPSVPEHVRQVGAALGFRSTLTVPMLRESEAVGAITVARQESARFSDAEVELLKTFADQAVIAIENVRLFKELEARNRDLTATSEILQVISRSPTDVQPVFDTIAERAMRLCDTTFGAVLMFDGALIHLSALANVSPEGVEALRQAFPLAPSRESMAGRVILTGDVVQIPDVLADPAYQLTGPAQAAKYRCSLGVPMLLQGRAIGVIVVTRPEPGTFSEEQIQLLKTFADQAVIAIQNVRLFKELQTRNGELTETLARQTATGEVLRAISGAQTDAQPVFDIIAASALRLCGASYGQVVLYDGEWLQLAALDNVNPEGVEAVRRRFPLRADLGSTVGRAVLTRAVVQIPDVLDDPGYTFKGELVTMGFRSILAVPMLRDGDPIGAIAVGRSEPGVFRDKQVELLQTFADQAVIAIENVRLFKELEARTHDLTRSVGELRALNEVGQAISSTLDLEAVLSAIVARATNLSETDAGVIYEYDDERDVFLPRATEHLEAEIIETMLATPVRKGEGATGRLAEVQEPIQVPDILAAPAESRVRGALVRAGYRALLAVPLVREGHLIGGLTVIRKATGVFAPETIELLQTFATQSSLAIQNARLFREIEEKSRQLEVASQHKSEFLANMSHELRTPLNAIIGFSEVLSERMFGDLNEKQEEYLKDIYASGGHLLSLINDILDLSKIEAGRMELELTDFDLPTAIDSALMLVRERAGRSGIALHTVVDKKVGQIQADERKIRQVVLNLLSNAIKFTPEGGRIEVAAVPRDGSLEISVSDTGVGIALEDQEAVFEEFRQVGTAAKKVEGTGLGLALSRKLIELHGGQIWVKSELGQGSTFTFTLPLTIDHHRQPE